MMQGYLFALLFIGAGAWLLWHSLRRFWLIFARLQMWFPSQTQEIVDNPPPVPSAEIAERLNALGFRFMGVTFTRMFGIGSAYIWFYLDPGGQAYAEMLAWKVGQHQALVSFSSWFPDHAFLQTVTPNGENIRHADFQSRFASTPEAAYAYHQQQITRWKAAHGAPVVFTSIADTIPYDQIYRQRHRVHHTRRFNLLLAAVGAVFFALAVGAFACAAGSIGAENTLRSYNSYTLTPEMLEPYARAFGLYMLLIFGGLFIMRRWESRALLSLSHAVDQEQNR